MPLRTDTIDLDAEADRLRDRREQFADQQVEFPMGSAGARQAAQEGQQADRLLRGIEWARTEWAVESITLAALTNGERHLVQMLTDTDTDAADAMRQNAYIATGTHDAPYLAHDPDNLTDPDERDAIKQTVNNVANLHPAFADWAERKISNLDRVDGDTGKSYRELVLEKRTQRHSTEDNG
jgi:hypothetical protein